MRVVAEIRSRLGVANFYVSGVDTDHFRVEQVCPSEGDMNTVAVRTNADAFEPTLLLWESGGDDDSGANLSLSAHASVSGVTRVDSSSVVFRLQSAPGVVVLGRRNNESLVTAGFAKRPKCLLEDLEVGSGFSVQCSTCNSNLTAHSDTPLLRLLPLPSVTWKEFAQDWFCACAPASSCNSQDHAGESAEPARDDHDHCCAKRGSSSSTLSNRDMAQAWLDPKPGDIFHSSSFVVVAAEMLDASAARVAQPDEDKALEDEGKPEALSKKKAVVSCVKCGAVLGLTRDRQGRSLQLWQHSVVVGAARVQQVQDAMEFDPTLTFAALVNGLLSECPEQAVSIHMVGHGRVLDLFVIEKELPVLLGDDSDVDGNKVILRRKTFRKVLFRLAESLDAWKKDFQAELVHATDDVIEVGLRLLADNQRMISPAHRQDRQWRVSYLGLEN